MNNFEILNLLEKTYGDIPTIARTQLLDIFNLFELELNQIEFSLKPMRDLNTFFKHLHLTRIRNKDHSILEKVLNNGSLFEHEINEYLFDHDEESPFSIFYMGFEEFNYLFGEYIRRRMEEYFENLASQNTETESDSSSRGTTGKASAKLTMKPNQKSKSKNRGKSKNSI